MANDTGIPEHKRVFHSQDTGEREHLTETCDVRVSQHDCQMRGVGQREEELIHLQSPDGEVSAGSSDTLDARCQGGFTSQVSADTPSGRASVPEKTKGECLDFHNANTVQPCEPCVPESPDKCMHLDGQHRGGDQSSKSDTFSAPHATRHDSTNLSALCSTGTCPSVGVQRQEPSPGIYHGDPPEPHAPCNSRSGLTCSDSAHHSLEVTSASAKQTEVPDVHNPNIVIFGETGVGKSSVINLIAGLELARTSGDALGCTFHHQPYTVRLGQTSCVLWDTTGLDEGSEGTVPAEQAESNLKELMQKLAHSGGLNLVIYCIRGSRLTRTLKRNYDIFYVTVCRKKVHVALVVTCLEHQEGEMDMWWTRNKPELRRHGMRFDAHACVTTLDIEDHTIQKRRTESQTLLRNLVINYSGRTSWKSDSTFMSRVLPSFHRVMHSAGNLGGSTIIRKVTACGSFTESFPGITPPLGKNAIWIGNAQYQVIQIDKGALSWVTSRTLEEFGGAGAGVLVFYTSFLVDNRVSSDDTEALKTFHDVAGGEFHPLIVVLRGCTDERVAQACGVEVASRHNDIQADFIPFPVTADARTKLEEMIGRKCVERVEPRFRFFRRYLPRQLLLASPPEWLI